MIFFSHFLFFFGSFFCCFFPPEVGEDKGTPKGTRGSGLVSETPIPGLSRGGREGFYGVSTFLRFHGTGGAEGGIKGEENPPRRPKKIPFIPFIRVSL